MGPHWGSCEGGIPADHEALGHRTEAGGALRIHQARPSKRSVPPARLPRSRSVQSLPEKSSVLRPPGTQPFRGLFLRASIIHRKSPIHKGLKEMNCRPKAAVRNAQYPSNAKRTPATSRRGRMHFRLLACCMLRLSLRFPGRNHGCNDARRKPMRGRKPTPFCCRSCPGAHLSGHGEAFVSYSSATTASLDAKTDAKTGQLRYWKAGKLTATRASCTDHCEA